ncbi:hypothetical protein C365_06605 [Cryptococcus neoformans Bt85]|nr:hypothetical protein C365_06605 [Cryptococcus neoformans var. grubii Bt85]
MTRSARLTGVSGMTPTLSLRAASARPENVAAVLQTNEHKRHWGKPMSAGDAEILNWTRTQLHMASQNLDIVRNFTREAAGAGVAPGNAKAGPLKAMICCACKAFD